jgi:hypothetical protein
MHDLTEICELQRLSPATLISGSIPTSVYRGDESVESLDLRRLPVFMTFSTCFIENANVWTKPDGANVWTFTEATGVPTYSAAVAPGGFLSWIAGFSFGGHNQPSDDFDNDGLSNLLEYVLNGNPSVSNTSILPQLVVTATDFEFSYSCLDLSLADTTQYFQYGSYLSGWTSNLIPSSPGSSSVGIATVTFTDTGSPDLIKVSIRNPRQQAVDSSVVFRSSNKQLVRPSKSINSQINHQ